MLRPLSRPKGVEPTNLGLTATEYSHSRSGFLRYRFCELKVVCGVRLVTRTSLMYIEGPPIANQDLATPVFSFYIVDACFSTNSRTKVLFGVFD